MNYALILTIALISGLLARRLSLPPLVGFLLAGFVIAEIPIFSHVSFQLLADTGVTLLLFAIGLKLDLRSLMRRQIWAVTGLHMLISIVLITLLMVILKALGWLLLANLEGSQLLVIGFALSFSSTVLAIKVLEERGEVASFHGRIAIGILVMQDIIAVVYLGASSGKMPTLYAPLLLLLIPARPLLNDLLKRCGHGELLILAGFALAFAGSSLFEAVNLKGDLGALYIGAILAGLPKAKEMNKILMHFKDILLVGFFLGICQFGIPSTDAWLMALLLTVVLLFKPLLYILLLTRFKLRARSAWLTALTLNNYSEFGLIVMAASVSTGNLPAEWLVILALALSMSFIVASIISSQHARWFPRLRPQLLRLEHHERLPEQQAIDIGDAKVLVLGMGRIGSGAYLELGKHYGDLILGIDESEEKASRLREKGMNIVVGDASDRELWERMHENKVELAILALSNQQETLAVVALLKDSNFTGKIAAVAKYDDEVRALREQGVISFNFYAEAGAGFAEDVMQKLAGIESAGQADASTLTPYIPQ